MLYQFFRNLILKVLVHSYLFNKFNPDTLHYQWLQKREEKIKKIFKKNWIKKLNDFS
jgi:hypothetical protein